MVQLMQYTPSQVLYSLFLSAQTAHQLSYDYGEQRLNFANDNIVSWLEQMVIYAVVK